MMIYTLILDNHKWTNKEDRLLNFISEKRKERIMRYRFESDKILSLYGALMIRMGVTKLIGSNYDKLEFSEDENGKPYLCGNRSIKFNLSHTKNALLCGFSSLNIGVDVEKIDNPCYDILPICFHIKEIELINTFDGELKKHEFYNLWTRKEAYVKWSGHGLYKDITKINTLNYNLDKNFTIWNDKKYNYAVYCEESNFNMQKIEVSVDEIYEYYDVTI